MGDPYVYPGTDVLRNKLGIRDNIELAFHEQRIGAAGLARLKLNPSRLPIGVARDFEGGVDGAIGGSRTAVEAEDADSLRE